MAPEQGLGEPGDRRSDTYAMGMILFEMVTGQLPFSADTSLALILKHINDPLPSPRTIVPDLAPAIEAIIYRATAKDPDDRYQTAGALATELRAATSGQEISSLTAMTASRQRRAARSYRRSSLGVMGAIIAVAAVVLIIGALSANPPGAPPDPTTTPTSVAVSAMTSRAIPVLTEFDPGDDFIDEWPESEGQLVRELVNGQYVLRSEIANQGYATVLSPDYYSYNSVRVETTATLNPDSQPSSGFGVIFRYHDNDNYYVFTINGNREVSIWIRDDGLWEELRGGASEWTRDDAVNPPGEPNLLTVEANGESFIGYVNQTPVVTVSDNRIASGSVGLYIATAIQTTLGRGEQALTEVAFDRFSADLFTPSMGTSGQ